MIFFTNLNKRFSQPDFIQMSLLFLTVLFFAFLITWPTANFVETNSFFAVSQVRLVGLLLIALSYGSVFSLKPLAEQRVTAIAVLALSLFSAPFEVASYAMSFPPLPLYWSLLITTIDTLAFLGIGFSLGYSLSFLRLRFLLPLAVPSILVAVVAADILINTALLNPLTALTLISLPHLFLMTVCATLCLVYLRPRKEPSTSS